MGGSSPRQLKNIEETEQLTAGVWEQDKKKIKAQNNQSKSRESNGDQTRRSPEDAAAASLGVAHQGRTNSVSQKKGIE